MVCFEVCLPHMSACELVQGDEHKIAPHVYPCDPMVAIGWGHSFSGGSGTFTVLLKLTNFSSACARARKGAGEAGRKNRQTRRTGRAFRTIGRASKRRVLLNAAEKIETAVECLSHRCSRWRLLPRTLPTKRFLDAPCLVIESGLQRWLPNAAVHVRAHAVGGIVSILLEH